MTHLLNLLAAIALLVWGTHLVRAGVLQVFGANLRALLGRSTGNRFTAALSGLGVTALVQSSTATSLMTASFVGQGLIALPAALAVMLGADVGTALMSVLFSLDLSWLSPLFLLVGIVLFLARHDTMLGRVGRVLIGLGLILLALRLVVQASAPLLAAPLVRTLLAGLGSDLPTELLLGAGLAVMAYSSLAIVLLLATMVASQVLPIDIALGVVLGANLGSGVLAVLTTLQSAASVRQVTVGNLVFKLLGVALVAPWLGLWLHHVHPLVGDGAHSVVLFHLAFNLAASLCFLGATDALAQALVRWIPEPTEAAGHAPPRPSHLDPSALATPSLAIACAAREALYQADLVESMLVGVINVIRDDDVQLSCQLRALDDTVDGLYAAIKGYLTQISRTGLNKREGQRWTEVISFTISMEQIADILERVLLELEDKKIKQGLQFSAAGMAEIQALHAQLLDNLRLAMGVFLHSEARDAYRLMEEKGRFRELERRYAAAHLARLSERTLPSMETSSLHIDLLNEFQRINSLLCSLAEPLVEPPPPPQNARSRPRKPHRTP